MDPLFRNKYSYKIDNTFDETKSTLDSILNTNSTILGNGASGNIEDDGSFSYNDGSWLGSNISWKRFAYLNGQIIDNGPSCQIDITVSANVMSVFAIYLLPLLLINVIWGDNSLFGSETGRLNNTFIVILAECAVLLITIGSSWLLKNSFEKRINATKAKLKTPKM